MASWWIKQLLTVHTAYLVHFFNFSPSVYLQSRYSLSSLPVHSFSFRFSISLRSALIPPVSVILASVLLCFQLSVIRWSSHIRQPPTWYVARATPCNIIGVLIRPSPWFQFYVYIYTGIFMFPPLDYCDFEVSFVLQICCFSWAVWCCAVWV